MNNPVNKVQGCKDYLNILYAVFLMFGFLDIGIYFISDEVSWGVPGAYRRLCHLREWHRCCPSGTILWRGIFLLQYLMKALLFSAVDGTPSVTEILFYLVVMAAPAFTG